MARLALLGGTGRLGNLLLGEALDRGLGVNVLARDPAGVRRHAENLNVFRGDVSTGEGLAAVLAGCRTVVSAISSEHPVLARCVADVIRHLQGGAMLARMVLVSQVLDDAPSAENTKGLFQRLLHPRSATVVADLRAAESALQVSGLEYVIVRTAKLTDDRPTHQVHTVDGPLARTSSVSREDLARYVVSLVQQRTWPKPELVLSSHRS